ncbi:MAG: trans-sulfuration enzyme family protein [Roseburia sp.]|uniref:trans-sulfuration enzyme family protein n=1 Tax=Roseburia hominis TaxID=301301 RepID=UPI001F3584CB|nr:PLP-dependent transferase [Roseburia hominis]MDY4838259.1 PLP-dependent aspartate aminotransferase family protein [Lachnospiraceae bacterium]
MKNFSNYTDYDTKENLSFDSKVVHGALGTEPLTGAVSMPIFQAATFRHPELGNSTGFDYSRLKNPTRLELERTMAILEGGIQGFAFSSGQAANMAVFSLLNPGDHVILSDDIYGGTFRIIGDVFGKYGVEHTYVDMSELDEVKAAIKENTRMFFVETPTNPMMKVADIQAISEIAKSVGALLVVDNTFLTPYFQKPLALGADIVTHSSTKYLGGHNDTISGIVVVKDNEEIAEKISIHIKSHGSQLSPMDSWLVLRGIKTLTVRMDKHNSNAKKVAEWLRTQKKVDKVYYVGFEDHKDYEVTLKQTTGFGGMISFSVDSEETVKKILKGVDMVMFAESLGGTETLITYPTTQTHEDTPVDVKEKLGITTRFLRMSVGIENPDDIIADLDRAMNA